MGGLSIPNNGLTDSAIITMSTSPKKSSPSFLLPAQLYKNLFASAILQKPACSDYAFPRNLLFSCEKSPNSRENDDEQGNTKEIVGCDAEGEDSKKLEKLETTNILWGGNPETGITSTATDTLTDNNQHESTNQTINNCDNSGNNNNNNNNSVNTSSGGEEGEEEEEEEEVSNSESPITSEINNNNAVTTDSNTTIGLVTLTGAPVFTSGTGSVGGGNTILQTNQTNPTQGLVHWMSAVMAEHINTNSHHDPTVGMHYMWNGTVDQCGQHNKEIDYGGWPGPRNHMAVKQGYEAKMTDHHNGIQKGHILDDGRIDHHTILQTQMPTAIYSATGTLRSASSNSNSPGIGTHLPGGTQAALLVVPQPINATKISGSTNSTSAGNGTTRKNQSKKKKSTNKRSQVYKSELQLQNQMHLRETKPYKCSQCTKAFANSSYLSQHTRIHLGIKPYRCEICQRKFTQLSHLQQHIRTHTGDKPYKCRHMNCQKAFSQLSNLQSHSRSHQTDKPYKCNSCYKCFQDEPSLLEHIPKHKESKHLKTHICQYCGKSYTQETYLQKHMQKHSERTDKRPPIALGLGINKNISVGTPISSGAAVDHPYWPKVSPDSATSLAEVMHHQQLQQQQQQAQQQQQQQQQQHQHHDFVTTLAQQHQTHQNGHVETMQTQHHHQQQQARDEVGEDLVVSRNTATTINQQQNNHIPSSTPNGTYDTAATIITSSKTTPNSAFTPIQAMTPHLNTIGHHQLTQRPYLYDAISFQNTKNATVNQNTVNAFPNQLISLHQIRNYAHQPGSIMAGEHILGVSVGPGKDKG